VKKGTVATERKKEKKQAEERDANGLPAPGFLSLIEVALGGEEHKHLFRTNGTLTLRSCRGEKCPLNALGRLAVQTTFPGKRVDDHRSVVPRPRVRSCAYVEGPIPSPFKLKMQELVPMLVLSRYRDESIYIGDDIVLTVVDVRGDRVRLGVQAPSEVSIHRQEVYEAIQREKQAEGSPPEKGDEEVTSNDASPVAKGEITPSHGTFGENLTK
jgi:carbon storage regulator